MLLKDSVRVVYHCFLFVIFAYGASNSYNLGWMMNLQAFEESVYTCTLSI